MPDTKICPLLSIGRAGDPAPCIEDRCPWWHEYLNPVTGKRDTGRCALVSIAEALTDIGLIGINVNNT